MYVEQYGAGQSIVFIHGSGCASALWLRQRDYLQASMEVVLVDLPGHGRSPGEGCNSIEQYGDAVRNALGGQTGCYIGGHSLGGAIAMYLALSHPDLVKGIILIGTGARLRVLPRILEGIETDKDRTLADINALSFSQATPAKVKEEVFGMTAACPPKVIHGDFTACDRFDIIDSLESIRIPTLILCGEDDMLTPTKYSRFLSQKIPNSKLILIEDAGHMVMVEKPDEVNKAIETFVEDCD